MSVDFINDILTSIKEMQSRLNTKQHQHQSQYWMAYSLVVSVKQYKRMRGPKNTIDIDVCKIGLQLANKFIVFVPELKTD